MSSLGSCGDTLSGEHLISKSVIHLLASESDFTVSGLPWLDDGEVRTIGAASLTAKCLCKDHNSALSPLDEAALFFFSAIKSALGRGVESREFLLSGHDLERWLLKTAKALAASKNLSRGRQRLVGDFATDVQVLEMLDRPSAWPKATGLYCAMREGQTTENHLRFQIYPYTHDSGEISGIGTNILGLHFILMLEPIDLGMNENLNHFKYRPGFITVRHPSGTTRIMLSWEDGRPHNEILSLEFLREVPRA